MTKRLQLLLTVGMTLASLTSLHGQSVPTNGLVAYYPFNGNANDASGNGRNGTTHGVTLTVDRFGRSQSAYYFNGSSYIDIVGPSPVGAPNTGWTLSAWVRPTVKKDMQIFTDYDNPTISYYSTIILTASGNLASGCRSASQPICGDKRVDGGAYVVNQWNHCLATWNPQTASFQIFLNGVSVGFTNYCPQSAYNISTTWYIGTHEVIAGLTGFFEGDIDDVRMYNRAFSSSEVAGLYNAESTTNTVPCSPKRATATAQIVNGFLVGTTLTESGCGYTNNPLPTVTITGGGGSGAIAQAVVSNGRVTAINIINAGSGYTSTPTITISAPPRVPKLYVNTIRVRVTMDVTPGLRYQLEASNNLQTWANVGTPFVATTEELSQDFDLDTTGRYFRIREVP